MAYKKSPPIKIVAWTSEMKEGFCELEKPTMDEARSFAKRLAKEGLWLTLDDGDEMLIPPGSIRRIQIKKP